jgi:hypothetical protein
MSRIITDYRPRRPHRLTPLEAKLMHWLGSLGRAERESYGVAMQMYLSDGNPGHLARVEDALARAGMPRGVVALLGCRLTEDE